jgi:ankyrin repeat protein
MPDDHAYPFVQALGSNNVAEVEHLLRSGRSVSERFAFGLTPLHVAAQHGAADCVSLLLERGAEREAHDEMGLTPLLYALNAGSRETAARLVSAGALIAYRYVPKDTPEIRAQIRRQHEELFAQSRQAQPLLHGLVDLAGGKGFQQQMANGYVETVVSPTDVHAVHHCGNVETLELIAQQPGVS